MQTNFSPLLSTEPLLASVVKQIVSLCRPVQIYLFSHKHYPNGKTASFKLAVIGLFADKPSAEQAIYLQIDSEVSFDVLLYNQEEWQTLCESQRTFAYQILQTGTMIYG